MPEKTYQIGVEATMEVIGGKWKSLVVNGSRLFCAICG